MEDKQRNNTFKSVVNYFKYRDEINEIDINYEKDDITTNKEVYQIELCQDGRFAATFDTANLRIKILQNTDYRPFIFNKKKNNLRNENDVEGSVEIDKTIAYFKINDDFSIEKLYDHNPPIFDDNKVEKETKKDNFRWSFDISNMYEKNDKCFVFVAISRINIDEDMKGTNKNDNGKSSYEREQLTQKIFKCPPSPNENDSVLNIPGSGTTQPESKKGIAIYRIELNRSYIISAVTCHYSNKISGLCKFIEVSSEEDSNKDYLSKYDYSELRRFIILNFRGIYNIEFDDNFDFLKLTEKFEYPQNIKIVLDNWLKFSGFADCTNRLLSCIYDKYFLVTRFNNGVQSLEVYNLAKMEHEVNARFVENIVNESYDYFFSVSGLQICFTQVNIVKLFLIENGLEIASKKFEELERIYLLEFIDSDKKLLIIGKGQGLKKGEDQKNEGLKVGKDLEEGKDQESNKDKEDKKVLKFIIWDLYNTGEHELVKLYDFPITKTNMDDIYTRLAITSGNILQIDDYGKISSVLKKFEKEINKKKLDKAAGPKVPNLKKIFGKLNGKDDENHTIHYDEKVNFKQIVNDREPWLPGGSKRTSYCLYYNEEGTKTETLQLIVGRSTVQIWHQINDDSKNKDELPNKGEAFLEYIWSNCIPVKQEREITRLRIEKFEYGPNYGSKSKEYDFYLKVYWFESNDSSKPEEHTKMTEHEIIKKENDEIDEIEDKIKKINENKDINEADKEKKSQEIINSCVKIKLRKKVIKGKDVIKKSHAARHACKALEHIRKRYKSKSDADNYKGHFSDEIITEGYLESLNHSDIKLRAFTPMVKLMSDKPKWYNRIWDTFKDFDSIFEENSKSSPNARFVLLRNPIGIKTKDSTYSGVATNSLTNETLDIKLKSDFDPMSSDSNPFTSFSEAMMATYFWINGDWVQRDEFDYWAVDVFTLIASIFLVIVLQNMLIAYMSNAYEDVTARSRQILLRLQVGFIKDYVALQHLHFSEPEPEPKHIYYSSQADYFEEWYNTKSDNDKGPIYKSFEINSTLTLSSIFIKKDYDKYSILAYDDNNIKMIIEDYIKLVSDNTEDLVKRVIDSEEFEDMKIDLDHILEKLKKKIYKL
ncbi:hypothetical protein RhiirB3_513703 [Rhizophagus irregularis]|nr:hypothetical protein RhiirB3_513703 [Rhizophagus irregularis]